MPSIPATATIPAARRVRPTPPSAHRATARTVACRPVRGSHPGLPAAVPGIRAATAARSRGLRTRHPARADRDRGQPAAAPGRRVQTVSARTCQTLTSSRTNRPFPRAAVLLPRVARDRGGALTRAGPAPSTARLRLRPRPPATGGLMVPAGRLTAQASATRSSTGRAGADPARTDPARTDPARAVPGEAQAGQGQGQVGLGPASTTLASRVRGSPVQRSLDQGSLDQGTTGLGRTGPSRTGREWRTMGRQPTRADRTSVSMVQGRDRTARKWVRTARKLVRTARGRVSTGLAMVHTVPGRTSTAPAARAAVPRRRAATAPAVTADSTVLGWATTARAGRTLRSTVPGWASTDRARSRTGRTRARARIRATATGTAEDPVSTAPTAASGDRERRIPGTATRAGPGRGRRDRPDRPDRGDQGAAGLASTGLSSTGLAITTKVRVARGNGDPADLALPGQARDPGKGSPGREAAAAG